MQDQDLSNKNCGNILKVQNIAKNDKKVEIGIK